MSEAEKMAKAKVQLYMYELTGGFARLLSRTLLGKEIEGIWHTAIVAYDQEHFFGSHGISSILPGSIIGQPTEIIDLGETEITPEAFQEFVAEMRNERFCGTKYHLLEHNCNNFSNEVAQFLTGSPIPAKITSMPSDIIDTPFGQKLLPIIESVKGQINMSSAVVALQKLEQARNMSLSELASLPSEFFNSPLGQRLRPFAESMWGQATTSNSWIPYRQAFAVLAAQAPNILSAASVLSSATGFFTPTQPKSSATTSSQNHATSSRSAYSDFDFD